MVLELTALCTLSGFFSGWLVTEKGIDRPLVPLSALLWWRAPALVPCYFQHMLCVQFSWGHVAGAFLGELSLTGLSPLGCLVGPSAPAWATSHFLPSVGLLLPGVYPLVFVWHRYDPTQ